MRRTFTEEVKRSAENLVGAKATQWLQWPELMSITVREVCCQFEFVRPSRSWLNRLLSPNKRYDRHYRNGKADQVKALALYCTTESS